MWLKKVQVSREQLFVSRQGGVRTGTAVNFTPAFSISAGIEVHVSGSTSTLASNGVVVRYGPPAASGLLVR